MKALVFVPGIMGTRLTAADGESLWPPTLPETTQVGYRRVDKLLPDDVKPGEVIRKVGCFGFYVRIVEPSPRALA